MYDFIDMKHGLPMWYSAKESTCQRRRHRDSGSISGSGRSPGGGNDTPIQYFCLGNSMDSGTWQAIVHGVLKSQK